MSDYETQCLFSVFFFDWLNGFRNFIILDFSCQHSTGRFVFLNFLHWATFSRTHTEYDTSPHCLKTALLCFLKRTLLLLKLFN